MGSLLTNNFIFGLLILSSSCLHVNAGAWSANSTSDSCHEERGGMFPCSSTITGNIILMLFYGGLLGIAAKFISDGAEMLLEFGLPPGIIGGVVLPFLGAVPDAAIIIASGMGDDAQEKLSVGMGTLAGSTVMLLTIAWTASLLVGRCDLNEKEESVDKSCKQSFSLTKQGVTLLPDVKSGITLMLMTSLFYFVVQSADWHWGATLVRDQPTYVKKAALATMILCCVGLIFYLVFSILDSKSNDRLVALHREEILKRKVLHTMLMLNNHEEANGSDEPAPAPVIGPAPTKKFFKAWHVKTGTKEIEEKIGLLEGEESKDEDEDEDGDIEANVDDSKKEKEQPAQKESKLKAVLKCASLLGGGFAVVTFFSDPMCDVLTALTNQKNRSYLPIPSFYVSFVVTPFCSNASELVSSLIFASKKTKDNITMTYSQLFGAATMNNTLCLAIFMALVYFKDLEWIYGAEVICIVVVQWVVGLLSYWKTYKVWMGVPVGVTYILCLLLVWVLEYKAGWH